MITEKVEKARWGGFLDQLSKGIAGKSAEIEVASLDLGDQVEAEWLPFLGMVYDRKSDAIEVVLEGLEEIILRPRQLSYVQDGGRIASLEVIDSEGVQRIVRLRDPVMLPPPAG